MSRARWCGGLTAAEFEIDTGDCQHRVSWRAGRLRLHDHDVEAEAVLRALGGEPCPCLLVLDALREAHEPIRRGGWASRRYVSYGLGPGAPVAFRPANMIATALQQMKRSPHWASMTPTQQTAALAQIRRNVLLTLLPPEMSEVIGQASEIRRERRMRGQRRPAPDPASAEDRLLTAVTAAAEAAMRRARRDVRPYAGIRVDCRRRARGEPPLLDGALDTTGGSLTLSLPVSWLNRVWRRGLAVVGGHLVLEVDDAAPAVELEGLAVRWERGVGGASTPSAVPCRLVRQADRSWLLMW